MVNILFWSTEWSEIMETFFFIRNKVFVISGHTVLHSPQKDSIFRTDYYQSRFPGLYAIYTETPERRRVNGRYRSITIFIQFNNFSHVCDSIDMPYTQHYPFTYNSWNALWCDKCKIFSKNYRHKILNSFLHT